MLNSQNLANLEKLGRYLVKLDTKYQREHFHMATFMMHDYDEINDPTEAEKIFAACFCGTSACAVGHAPIALKQEVKDIDWYEWAKVDEYSRMDKWLYLTIALFGKDFRGSVGGSALFSFMFGGDWGRSWNDDNHKYNATSWSAADRIAYLFEVGQDDLEKELRTCDDHSDIPFIGAAMRMGWMTKGQFNARMSAAKKGLTQC